ncbi:MAG: hypothetical protein ACRCX7_14470 [Cetobacterium sp.]|uniref:hypothetical protein n=1 Tax=Cetobacterium sp. TaxID=2071632 RepID=UPI003F2C1A26
MANKFISPVEFDLMKSIPALQGVNMEGVQPFNGNQKEYQALVGAIGDMAKNVYQSNQTREFNNLMLEMDNINQDTTFAIQNDLGVDWASTEEGRQKAVEYMNGGIQRQKDMLLENKSLYSEDRWKQLDNYFKKSTYSQLQTMQSNVYQGYIKQGMQEFGLSQGMFQNRIGSILATNALNQSWVEPTEEIDTAISDQFKYIDSNQNILQEAGVVEQKYKILEGTYLQTLDYKLKKSIINDTQNPAYWTKMVDSKGEVVVDDSGKPVYLRDESGLPIPDIVQKSKAVQDMSKEVIRQIQSGETVEQWTKKYGLDNKTAQAIDGALKANGIDAVNKAIQQMGIALGEQRKENEGKVALAYDSANVKRNNTYNNIVGKTQTSNNIVEIGGLVNGTAYTSANFIRPKINPITGEVLEVSPIQKLTGKNISELNRNNTTIDGFISDAEKTTYKDAMNTNNPVESLHQAFKESMQEYKSQDERDAWMLNMGKEFSSIGLSESVIQAIANPTPENEGIRNMANDVLRYRKDYKADYNETFDMLNDKATETYSNISMAAGMDRAVLNTVVQYVGNRADVLAEQFPKLSDSLKMFREARNKTGQVDSKLFMQGIMAAATDDRNFYNYLVGLIPDATKVTKPTRTYTPYQIPNNKKTEWATEGANREYNDEINRKAYQLNISPEKLKEKTGGMTGVKVKVPKQDKSYVNMESW